MARSGSPAPEPNVRCAMISHKEAYSADIVWLTKAAVQAAREGRWDVVIQCYAERGSLLKAAQGSVHEADELLTFDHQIRDLATTVQAALRSLIDDASTTRQRLQGLRQRLGVQVHEPKSLSLEA